MAYNDKKILQVLLDECNKVPERCKGYRGDMVELLGEILTLERENAIARINIVKKISDQVNTTGMELYKKSPGGNTNEEA